MRALPPTPYLFSGPSGTGKELSSESEGKINHKSVENVSREKNQRKRGIPALGYRYIGNKNKLEVHDLKNEQDGPSKCQIEKIIQAGNAIQFNPDTLQQGHSEGYDNCAHCIGRSKR